MKKLLLLAAFGVAGMMNAKTIAISHDEISFSDTSVSVFEESEWCGTVTFMTSWLKVPFRKVLKKSPDFRD